MLLSNQTFFFCHDVEICLKCHCKYWTEEKLREKLSRVKSSFSDCSDDEVCSNASRDKGLECPICWESFNIVENVPYVLWCGHTLCKNWVLGLQLAVLKFPTQQIKIPYFVSCPWCHLMSFRLVCNGNLKSPRKNLVLNKEKKNPF